MIIQDVGNCSHNDTAPYPWRHPVHCQPVKLGWKEVKFHSIYDTDCVQKFSYSIQFTAIRTLWVWRELHIFAWASKAEVYNCQLPHCTIIVACCVLREAVLLQVWRCKGDWLGTWLFNSHLYRMAQNKVYGTSVTLPCCVILSECCSLLQWY